MIARPTSFRLLAGVHITTAVVIGLLASSAEAQALVQLDVLHAFSGETDGGHPAVPLVQADDGNFYGTTRGEGSRNPGTIFTMDQDGTTTTLHVFDDPTGAANSNALIQAIDGNLYGTNSSGGAFGFGSIFSMTLDGTFTVVYSFDNGAPGTGPVAALLQASDGNFYGTTPYGGSASNNAGTVFRMTPDGTVTVLHAFPGTPTSDGKYPNAALIQASDGYLYGTTSNGGAFDRGTVFRITLAGDFAIVHHFMGAMDGSSPAGVIEATGGTLYGVTAAGGAFDFGTAFTMTRDGGTFSRLHTFTGADDDSSPVGPLVQASDGSVYGVTASCCDPGTGTIFQLSPDGTFTVLYTFTGGEDGRSPSAGLTQASDGTLYGTTYWGGDGLLGVVFRLSTNQ